MSFIKPSMVASAISLALIGMGTSGALHAAHPTLGAQVGQHGFVVDEIAQDGQRLTSCGICGKGDCIPHSKTHPQMFSSNDLHTSLCTTK